MKILSPETSVSIKFAGSQLYSIKRSISSKCHYLRHSKQLLFLDRITTIRKFELKSELSLKNCCSLRKCLNQYCTDVRLSSVPVHAWIMSNNMSAQSFDTHIVDSIMELICRKKRELIFLSAKHQFRPHFPLIVKSECQSIGHNKSQCTLLSFYCSHVVYSSFKREDYVRFHHKMKLQ